MGGGGRSWEHGWVMGSEGESSRVRDRQMAGAGRTTEGSVATVRGAKSSGYPPDAASARAAGERD